MSENSEHFNMMVNNRLEKGSGLFTQWELVNDEIKEYEAQIELLIRCECKSIGNNSLSMRHKCQGCKNKQAIKSMEKKG